MKKSSLDVEPFPGYAEQRFAVENGDGEPELLHPRFVLQRVIAPWFKIPIGQWGPAWLMRIVEGPRTEMLLAYAPRGSTIPIEVLFAHEGGWDEHKLHLDPDAFNEGTERKTEEYPSQATPGECRFT
jgi:hypothetical protein